MNQSLFESTIALLEQNFRPTRPVDDERIFSGRKAELEQVQRAIRLPGQHVIIYGERGVGKTSLANIVAKLTQNSPESRTVAVSEICNTDDGFASVWRRLFKQIPLSQGSAVPGQLQMTYAHTLAPNVTPDEVYRQLVEATETRSILLIVDEFDQIKDPYMQQRFSNTVKTLSDKGTDCTLILVGVASSVTDLLKGHQSIDRALAQISMPRMTTLEIEEIVHNGLTRSGLQVDDDVPPYVAMISQGLPQYAHLLGLEAGRCAVSAGHQSVCVAHVDSALPVAIRLAQESIKTSYHQATSSPRKDNLYKEVLLACALAVADDMSSFAPSDVRMPLEHITNKAYSIQAYLQHLKSFTEVKRGQVLEQQGEARRYRYRFANPLMRPHVIMRGITGGVIDRRDLSQFIGST